MKKLFLFAPSSWWGTDPEVRKKITNGCGPKGWGWLVPDTIYGVDISAACCIHDYFYLIGVSFADKKKADRIFLNNLIRIINYNTRSKFMRWLRLRRAEKYYYAVKYFGGPAFWASKNNPVNMGEQ